MLLYYNLVKVDKKNKVLGFMLFETQSHKSSHKNSYDKLCELLFLCGSRNCVICGSATIGLLW